jgi:outer membrane receptor protein involved in Fe transport
LRSRALSTRLSLVSGWLPVWAVVWLVTLRWVQAQSMGTTVHGDSLLRQAESPTSVTTIEVGLPGQASAPNAYRLSVAELLVGQPGVQVRRSGGLGQWSGASLRGAAPGQVAVFLDGVPLSRGSQAAVDLSVLPLDGLERVEVYRGVPPLALGSETLGGAINLVTRRGQGPQTAWASLGSGSFGLKRVSLGYKTPRPKAMVTIGYQGADGDFPYYFNEGLRYEHDQLAELRRRNDDFAQVSADARLQTEGTLGSVFLHGSGLLRRQGVAGIGQPSSLPGQPTLQTGRALINGGARLRTPSPRIAIDLDGHLLVERTQFKDLVALPATLTEQLVEQAGLRSLLRVLTGPGAEKARSQLLAITEFRYERMQQRDLCPAPAPRL